VLSLFSFFIALVPFSFYFLSFLFYAFIFSFIPLDLGGQSHLDVSNSIAFLVFLTRKPLEEEGDIIALGHISNET
jgi:hypothetical protein